MTLRVLIQTIINRVKQESLVICISGMPSEVYLMWHKYPWIFGHLACDAKIVLTKRIAYSAVGTALAASVEKLVTYNTELVLQHYC